MCRFVFVPHHRLLFSFVRFPPAPRCGEAVLVAEGLRHGYASASDSGSNSGKYQTLFEHVDLQVQRGDRIGFIGPNGAGMIIFY